MNIKELNKLIKEELDAFLENEDEADSTADNDISVTTDEPDEEEDPLALLRQIYDMLKPVVDDGGMDDMEDDEEMDDMEDEEGEEEMEDEEGDGDEKEEEVEENFNTLNESRQLKARFRKLANIKK
tara:strand:+ start:812 stop:1189 length:378 start_codon:yes stop_codon:yes gene_type:complete